MSRSHWGDVADDADDAHLDVAALDVFVSRPVAELAAASTRSMRDVLKVIERHNQALADTTLRHLLWAARHRGRVSGVQLVALARLIAESDGAHLEDDELRTFWDGLGHMRPASNIPQ